MNRFAMTLAFLSAGLAPAFAQETEMSKDETTVLATVMRLTNGFQTADTDAVMGSYLPGAVVAFEPGQPVSGDDLVAMVQGFFTLKPQFSYSGHDVMIAGDLALHIAPWSMQGTAPDGTPLQQSGLSVSVLQRQPDGSWAIAIDNPHGQRLLPVP